MDQEQALANLLDDLITTDPQATNPQPMPSTTDEKTHNLNVCPFHECNLILFKARTNENVYIKCQIDHCPIFMHEVSAYYYISNMCGRLHESHLKGKRILICGCKEAVSLRVSKAEKKSRSPLLCMSRQRLSILSVGSCGIIQQKKKTSQTIVLNNSLDLAYWKGGDH